MSYIQMFYICDFGIVFWECPEQISPEPCKGKIIFFQKQKKRVKVYLSPVRIFFFYNPDNLFHCNHVNLNQSSFWKGCNLICNACRIWLLEVHCINLIKFCKVCKVWKQYCSFYNIGKCVSTLLKNILKVLENLMKLLFNTAGTNSPVAASIGSWPDT